MKSKTTLFSRLILSLVVLLAGCASQPQVNPTVLAVEPTAQPAQTDLPTETVEPSPASTAVAVVQGFFTAYQANVSGAVTQPVADPNYPTDARLTRRLVSDVQTLEAYLRGMPPEMFYDLFLMAKSAPASVTARSLSTEAGRELVIVDETFADGSSQSLTVLAVETDSGWQIDDVQVGNPETPEGAAQLFFNEYVQRLNINTQDGGGFDLQPFLSADFQQQAAQIRAGFEGAGFDPVMQAQAAPPDLGLVEAVNPDGAATRVDLRFGGWTRTVWMQTIDGHWQVVPDGSVEGDMTPAKAADAFYAEYLSALSSGSDADVLASPLISSILRGQLESQASDLKAALLCSTELPTEMRAVASFDNQSRPVVVLTSDLPGHSVVVDLIREDFNRWALRQVTCGNTAQGVAKAFYTWYLGYATGETELRSPLSDGAYQEVEWLSADLKASLAETIAAEDGLAVDPVLFAQDLPARLGVAPCEEDGCALINLQFGEATVQQIRVDVESQDGAQRITDLSRVMMPETSEPATPVDGVDAWAPYSDGAYGFALRYPAAWPVNGLTVTDLHTPEEYPWMRSISFVPAQGEGQRAVLLDVVVSEQDPAEGNYAGEPAGDVQANGAAGRIIRQEYGALYVIFQHPSRSGVWVVFTLNLSDLPGLDPLPAGTTTLLDAMASTLVFSE